MYVNCCASTLLYKYTAILVCCCTLLYPAVLCCWETAVQYIAGRAAKGLLEDCWGTAGELLGECWETARGLLEGFAGDSFAVPVQYCTVR